MKTFLQIVDDKVIYANAGGFFLSLTEAQEWVKLLGGIAVLVYTCIKIYQSLNAKGKA